jgi:CheY-like chemotaxis protein
VERDLATDLPPVHGDAHQLGQVVINLLTNATHAIGRTGRGGVVTVRTRRDGSGVVLEVADDGPGVPAAIRSKIFDPFFTTKPPGQGTGLGLSLAYGIVAAHGGAVEVLPTEGGGATFRIGLPGVGPAVEPAASGDRPEAAPAAPRPGRVLVVEDEEPLARLMCEALAEDGHRVEAVPDGAQALARLAGEDFDVVVSDLRMPVMDGERLVRELGSSGRRRACRVLLVTGDTVSDRPAEVEARTGLEVLHKPFDLEELRRRVRALSAASSSD